jgi:hypothetical protein
VRALWALSLADLRERTRRYSFLVTLIFGVYLGYAVVTGLIQLRLGDTRGVFNSAWVGAVMSAVATTFLALVGFYVVKDAVERDRRTGVGQILATTPLSRVQYTLGKTVSNFLLLTLLLGVLAVAALVMQMWRGEVRNFDPVAFFAPMIWVAAPTLLFIAALAVFFETTPGLAGGFGNVLYFFVWAALLTSSAAENEFLDPTGLNLLGSSMREAARAHIPGYDGGISLTLNPGLPAATQTIVGSGIQWTPGVILQRLPLAGAALLLAVAAAIPFDRFDTARRWFPTRGERAPGPAEDAASRTSEGHATTVVLPAISYRPSFVALARAELLLMLRSGGWRWWIVAVALVVAQFLTPLAVSRGPLLFASWLWPLLLWSAMGCREGWFGTGELVFSGPRFLPRQFAAIYLAGVAIALLSGAGAGARLVLAGDPIGLASWLAGAAFVPAMALASGSWSGSGKLFEALYTILWYLGPLNRTAAFDYTGAHAPAASRALVYAIVAAALLAIGYAGRIQASRRRGT